MSGKYRCAIYLALVATAFAQAPRRIHSQVNLRQTVRLPGNTVWRAHAAVDEGAAPPDLELQHMLLLLRRSPTQEAALRQLLAAQRTAGSPAYHRWLTPQQFGKQFGPAAGDIATAEQWLEKQGFTVGGVSPGGLAIDFGGTAANVQQALHATMHRYRAQRPGGTTQEYWANATDPAIPAALAPVVAGVVSLNNFVSRPAIQVLGQGNGHVATVLDPSPELNFTYNGTNVHALVPGDFNTIYNVSPLLAQGVNGGQQTIAVVARSVINPSDVSDFRHLFQPGATGSFQVKLATANDPGIATNGDQDEATLDAEWAGAAAPSATVDLVVAASSATTDGVTLSALYIVDHDLAPILTASYGLCEAQMTAAGNEFFNSLWEQAAAEGITVLVSAGDNGAAGCDDPSAAAASNGLAVSGFASTPYDTAVGGTQFNEGSSTTSYWGTNRTTDFSSALGYIPEQPWDEIGDGQGGTGISAGSGGSSSVYSRPYWQVAPGVAAISGGMRLLPDVSFNASAGHDPYVICLGGSCQVASDGSFHFYVVGGTSASAPSFAGVMALVDQKAGGTQGLANPVLYRLASTSGVFHDTTSGSNDVPCVAGSADCPSSGELGFNAAPGYDEATGLGSIDIANLVDDWSTIRFAASKTALMLTPPANATVGQSIPLNINVTGGSSGPAPTGTVDLLTQFSDGTEEAVGSLTLGSGGTFAASTAGLPGGTYNVVASYEGDANYGPSTSAPVSVTMAKAQPTIALGLSDSSGQPVGAMIYGDTLNAVAAIAGASDSFPLTGTVAFTYGGTTTFGIEPVSATGGTSFSGAFPPVSADVGTFALEANYSGDSNYLAATSKPVSLVIEPSPTSLAISESANDNIEVTLNTQSQGAAPIGMITMYNGAKVIGYTVGYAQSTDPKTGFTQLHTDFQVPIQPGRSAIISAQFPGTKDFLASTSNSITVPTPANEAANPSSLTFAPLPYGQTSAAQTLAISNSGGEAAPATLGGLNADFSVTSNCPSSLTAGASCSVSVVFHPVTSVGINASGAPLQIGYLLIPVQAAVDTFFFGDARGPWTANSGQSLVDTLPLYPSGGFTGTVSLSCSNLPPFSTCSFSPATVALNGMNESDTTVTITTTAPPSGSAVGPGPWPDDWCLLLLALVAFAGLILLLCRHRPVRVAFGALLLAFVAAACGGGEVAPPPPPPPPPATSPETVLNSTALAFGTVAVGQVSAAQPVTLTNNGTAGLQISSIAIGSGNASDFKQTNDCGATLAASASCKISVTYAPSVGRNESSQLTITDNASGSPQKVALSGTGTTSTPSGSYTITVTGTAAGQPPIMTTLLLVVNAPAAAAAGRGVRERASPKRR